MQEEKGSHGADVLLKVAVTASVGYLVYDAVTAHFAGLTYNVFLAAYFMIVPGFLIVRRARNKTLRGDQVLCISLLGYVVVLYLTTTSRFWPVFGAVLFVAVPSILSFVLLEKDRIQRAQSSS